MSGNIYYLSFKTADKKAKGSYYWIQKQGEGYLIKLQNLGEIILNKGK